jgi:hypothetical protein
MVEKKVFFISRAGADRHWGELIASVVRDAGHEVIYQDEHFSDGPTVIGSMRAAHEASDCTIAVLSSHYFHSEYCVKELNTALYADPSGDRGRILPVLVDRCDLPGDVAELARVDLVGASGDTARKRLLDALLRHGKLDASELVVRGRTRRVVEQASRNRTAMIEKVRTIWITGFLQKSLFQEVQILLGLSERPNAVARPLDLLVKRPDEGERPLPAETRVVDVFDSMDRSLLILGAPGSGKTTLLLELARDLLDRAEQDSVHPIPVIFPLSTWAQSRKPLVKWLQDELNLRYDVPRKLAEEWVATDQVLPLLDGLDEVKGEHRAACVETINTFRQSHGFLPLAITSRTADYVAVAEPLRLHGAILVRPLTCDQVNAYLSDLGSAGEPVRLAVQADRSLWELLDSPLLLNVVIVAYAGHREALPRVSATVADAREHLFGTYVNQMLLRRANKRYYTSEQTAVWLSWLASQMANHGQSVLSLEGLQLDWFPHRQRRTIRACNMLAFGLAYGLVFGLPLVLVLGFNVGSHLGLGIGLVIGLAGGLSGWLRSEQEIRPVDVVRWSWPGVGHVLPYVDSLGLILMIGLVVGLGTGLVIGLLVGPVVGLVVGLVVELLCVPLAGLLVGLAAVMDFVMHGGLYFSEVEARSFPNEGIYRSGRNAMVVWLLVWLLIWLATWLLVGLVPGLVRGFATGLVIGFDIGFIRGLQSGGETWLKHVILRLWLIRNGSTPWNYVKFLDYAAERILLRKVGGGYAFIHRMLLEHLAARYVEPAATAANPAMSSSTAADS